MGQKAHKSESAQKSKAIEMEMKRPLLGKLTADILKSVKQEGVLGKQSSFFFERWCEQWYLKKFIELQFIIFQGE